MKKIKCSVCGQAFVPRNPEKCYTYIGYKSQNFCSDECWYALAGEAEYDTGKIINAQEGTR